MNNTNKLILSILFLGIVFKLLMTSNGNFLFNMDNGRDMVDVREMVVLQKPRLTGPTSAIEGLFNGPGWYYLLAVPFIITHGDPYGAIIMEFVLWAIGGFFLLKIVAKWSKWLIVPIGIIWISSNYITLTTVYAFNPNPIILLTPFFIYLLDKYLEKGKLIFGASIAFLGGLFFNFEMNFGIFIPIIILVSTLLIKKISLIKNRNFFLSAASFVLTLLPQIFFDLRHQFIMTNSVLNYLRGGSTSGFNILERIHIIPQSFYNTYLPTLMNQKILASLTLISGFLFLLKIFKNKVDRVVIISLSFIFVPLILYIFIPVSVNPWHLGGEMAAAVILIAYLLKELLSTNLFTKFIGGVLIGMILWAGFSNILNFFINDLNKPSSDPSLFRNELAAIDYVYQKARGKNFKVYTYLPSVYDYPYQYIFWWYGKKTYGYIPGEYVYSPNKPKYIPSQEKFQGDNSNFSGLVFLIKEPDRIGYRTAWENDYKNMEFISKEMVGPIEVEVRREVL